MFRFVPLPIFKELVLAFEHIEGFVFMSVGVGWRAAVGRRSLGEGRRQAAGGLAGDEDFDGFAEDFEVFESAHELGLSSLES
jgi:hypothetical protein